MSAQASMQPKAAVEFDQAINYVNKIKVPSPLYADLDRTAVVR